MLQNNYATLKYLSKTLGTFYFLRNWIQTNLHWCQYITEDHIYDPMDVN